VATVGLVLAEWSGTTGGPGVSTFAITTDVNGAYTATHAQAAVNRVRTFFDAVKTGIPNEVTITVSPNVDQFDVASATLTGTIAAATAPTSVLGGSSNTYSGGVGLRVDWNTSGIVRGRRVRGRTYLVPYGSGAFDTSGGADTTWQATVTTAANALRSGLITDTMRLSVWSRPNAAKGYTGNITEVSGASVPDKSAILRTRRD
jgi:hypothetical protein